MRMLENFNDYLSLIIMIICAFCGLRFFVGSLFHKGDIENKQSYSILYNYPDNEDD